MHAPTVVGQPEILSVIARPTLLPRQVKECRRLLRPGGVLAIADNNPRSKVIQNLPPVLFTLMKRWVRALACCCENGGLQAGCPEPHGQPAHALFWVTRLWCIELTLPA